MSYRLEHGMIQLGGEAWPAGVRGEPESIWVNRPARRVATARLIFAVVAVLGISFGAVYFIGQESGLLGGAIPIGTLR